MINKRIINFLNNQNIDLETLVPLSKGISNENYLINDKYVLKLGNIEFFNMEQGQIDFENSLLDNSAPIISYSQEEKIILTKYIPDLKNLKETGLNDNKIINLTKLIKSYSKLTINNLKPLDYISFLNGFRNNIPQDKRYYIQELEESYLLTTRKVPSHFDLVDNNINFIDDKVIILDFEYACYAPLYFDLTSLISENELDKTTQDKILNQYFYKDINKYTFYLSNHHIYKALFDYVWYHWAYLRYLKEKDSSKKEEFLKIAQDKEKGIKEFLKRN